MKYNNFNVFFLKKLLFAYILARNNLFKLLIGKHRRKG